MLDFRSTALAKTALVVVALLAALIFYMPAGHADFLENWGDGTFGLRVAPMSSSVAAVVPGSPAARAGIAPGDRLLLRAGTASQRRSDRSG